MPFSPSTTSLNTLNEFKNLSHTITYVSGGAIELGTLYGVVS